MILLLHFFEGMGDRSAKVNFFVKVNFHILIYKFFVLKMCISMSVAFLGLQLFLIFINYRADVKNSIISRSLYAHYMKTTSRTVVFSLLSAHTCANYPELWVTLLLPTE